MHSEAISQTQIKTVALVAAFNEADRIGATIAATQQIPQVDRIVVVDDGSTDATAEVAEEHGAEVIRMTRNVGKGAALAAALPTLSEDIVLFLDADLGPCALEGAKLLEPVLAGRADMAIADFPKAKTKGGFGLVKSLGAWGIRRFSDYQPQEPLSGQRAVRRKCLEGVSFESGYGLEVGMTIDVVKKGYKVVEIPVLMTHRETGRDLRGFIHRGKQYLDILIVILKRLLADN